MRWFVGAQRLALALRFHLGAADARLQLQQLQLFVRQLLAAWPVFRDPLQPQPFLQHLDL